MAGIASEVIGLDQSIAYAQHLAEQARAHSPAGNEGYLGRLRDFYDRLDLQIHLDDHDGLDLRAPTHQAGGTR
jgi:hypothetical protein